MWIETVTAGKSHAASLIRLFSEHTPTRMKTLPRHTSMNTKVKDLIPDSKTWVRGAVASIPFVGGALDHLVFDKADSIRIRNIEKTVQAMSERLSTVPESQIDKAWFESEEALATFRLLAEKASFEPDKTKVDDLGRLGGTCGLEPQSKDTRKLTVLEHLSRLSSVQIRLLKAIAQTPMESRTAVTGAISQTANAIWLDAIVRTLENGPRFWSGTLQLNLELDLLEAMNVIRQVSVGGFEHTPYTVTPLGQHAARYVVAAGL